MVTNRTQEWPRRYTYAERTVTAISDIRKRHPRGPIPLRTLKTQIRRNAEAQEDALGPNWQTYVNNACRVLTARGILDKRHPPAHITVAPEGRELIAKTRRFNGTPHDHKHTPHCREDIGRKVIRRLPDSPAKSRRSSSVATTVGGKFTEKPLTKMTKAELLEAHKKLKGEYESLKRESSRKLADLNAELEKNEDDMLEYRDRLSGFDNHEEDGDTTLLQDYSDDFAYSASPRKTQNMNVDKETTVEVHATQATPHPITSDQSQLDLRPISDISMRRRTNVTVHPLIRTQSGSFISSISKQPTPAPSDAGTESLPGSPAHEYMEIEPDVRVNPMDAGRGANTVESDFFNDDANVSFDPDMTIVDAEEDATLADKFKDLSATQSGNQTHTPTSSPPRILRRYARDAAAIRKRFERLEKEKQAERIEFEKKLSEKDDTLEEREDHIWVLEERLADHNGLEEEVCVLRERSREMEGLRKALEAANLQFQLKINDLEEQFQAKSVEMNNIEVLLKQKDEEAQQHATATVNEKARSDELTEHVATLQQELSDSELARQTLQGRLDVIQAEKDSVLDTLRNALQDQQINTINVQAATSALVQELMQKRDECERLRTELQASTEQTHEARVSLAGVQAKLFNEVSDRNRLENELAASLEKHETLERTSDILKSDFDLLKRELEIERNEGHSLHESFREVAAQKDNVLRDLEDKQAALFHVQDALTQMDAEFSLLHDELVKTQAVVNELQGQSETLQAKVRDASARAVELEQALRDAEQENADLKEGYEKLKKVHMEAYEEMDQRVSKKRKRASMPPPSIASMVDMNVNVGDGSAMEMAF